MTLTKSTRSEAQVGAYMIFPISANDIPVLYRCCNMEDSIRPSRWVDVAVVAAVVVVVVVFGARQSHGTQEF